MGWMRHLQRQPGPLCSLPPFTLLLSFSQWSCLQSLLLLPWFESSDLRIKRDLGCMCFPLAPPEAVPSEWWASCPSSTVADSYVERKLTHFVWTAEVRAQDNPDSPFELQPVRYWNYSYSVPFPGFLPESKYFQFSQLFQIQIWALTILKSFLWADSSFPIDPSKCALSPQIDCYKEVCPATEVSWATALS